ncbi:MAG: hypothetical protein DRJ03_19865 [Chloroflexi bacterium]|nr:MAG: hypothetical protein DRJ03_19865 [Chloroflexota bacterium]
MTQVHGFDSRFWDGKLSQELLDWWEFVGIKISEGTSFVPRETPNQWYKAKAHGLLRLPFHYWRTSYWWEDPTEHGKNQAQFMYDTITTHFDGEYGELPPVLDIEDTKAPAGDRTIKSIKACLLELERLFGRKPMIYTAGWWFDPRIKNSFSPEKYGGWDIYSYDLWEADPPPDTACGEWTESAIVQYKLDASINGINAGVDFNETTQEWIDKVTILEEPQTDCEDCMIYEKEIERLLKEMKEHVERLKVVETKIQEIRDILSS